MKSKGFLMVAAALVALTSTQLFGSGEKADMSPAEAMQRLEQGNARYVTDAPTHPRANIASRQQTAEHGQHPFATVIACSDSRVPVEILFDQGVGDLFVIRVARQRL